MSSGFSFYPMIDGELLTKLGLHHTGLKLSYWCDSEEYDLENETDDSTGYIYTISDKRNIWNPETHNIKVRKEFNLNNPSFLFGTNGVCSPNGIIGLAINWACKGTNSRGTIMIGEVDKNTTQLDSYVFEHVFDAGTLRNTLDIELFAYIKKRGTINNQMYYVALEGVKLGVLDTNRLVIDGSSSVFPIVTVEEPSQPLWWVNIDYDDPTEDPFSAEYISIRINKAHKNYKKLESEDGIKGNSLLVEIMATSVQIIVDYLKDTPYWESIEQRKQLEQGSIGEAISYILETYELQGLSQEQFARQIRVKLGER